MSACPGRAEALSALLDDALEAEPRQALEAHLADCAGCQAERAALEQVRAQVRGLPRLSVPNHFTAQVMAAVLQAEPEAAPAAVATAGGCGELAEDLSATLDDGVLAADAAQRIQRHLTACGPCRAEQDRLRRLQATLQGLPRLQVPEGFLERVLAAVEAVEAEKVTRFEEARARRQAWWGRLGGFAQAAGLLLLVGAGSFLSTPEAAPLPSYGGYVFETHAASGRGFVHAELAAAADEAVGAPAPAAAPLPEGPYAAVLALDAGERFDEARAALAHAVQRYARATEGQLETDGFEGYVVQVPANLTDDLLRELGASPSVRPARGAEAEIDRINTELDTVVLRSGHVFVGHVQRQGREVVLTVGETQLRFPAQDVASITPADSPRRLRIELHQTH